MSKILSPQEAASKQKQLLDNGYTIVPNILKDPLLSNLRNWSNDVFNRVPVDPKYKYQGSDIHVYTEKAWKKMGITADEKRFPDPIVEELMNYPDQKIICTELGLENLKPRDNIILLSKPPFGPPLYWHQDFMNWNHPESASPWPTVIFLSYYMNNTSRQNGCLRVIPGSHCKRDPLHDILPDAHGPEIQSIEDLNHPIFQNHPDSVDVPLNTGDLIIADARLLHAAWPNKTNERRTLVLAWHEVFNFPNPPTWWDKEIPDIVKLTNDQLSYTPSRKPIKYPR